MLTLLDAIQGLDVILKIVGDGPMRAKYEKHAFDNNISNVVFEGYKSGEELKNIFRNAAFLVMPSEWYENAPMTVLEAYAYGKPIIGANIGGIPEMVEEGKTGLLFQPCDTEGLRKQITRLLSSPSDIVKMGRSARARVEKDHNASVHYDNLMRVYEAALK